MLPKGMKSLNNPFVKSLPDQARIYGEVAFSAILTGDKPLGPTRSSTQWPVGCATDAFGRRSLQLRVSLSSFGSPSPVSAPLIRRYNGRHSSAAKFVEHQATFSIESNPAGQSHRRMKRVTFTNHF